MKTMEGEKTQRWEEKGNSEKEKRPSGQYKNPFLQSDPTPT